ncbi:MAG: STAS domain-containing protein [Mariprofundaceae bacterium]|nr:STAS domain-containing protein [Mariprofundaceae bacterium]
MSKLHTDRARVGMSISQGVLLIPLQVELYDDVLLALQEDALQYLEQHALKHMLLDLSQLQVIDQHIAQQLAQLMHMASLLGTTGVVTGIQPAVAVALADGQDIWAHINTALTLDAGLKWLKNHA